GFYLGNNKSGYVGVAYDITDYLNYDKENILVVRVDATQYEGWFYEGAGIYRHVWLNQFSNLHIASNGVFIYSKVSGKSASITVDTTVENKNLASSKGSIVTYLTDRNGKKIAQSNEQADSLTVNQNYNGKQNLTITNPNLWSLDDPYLYRIVSV